MGKYFIAVTLLFFVFLSTNYTKELEASKTVDYTGTKRAYFAGGCFWGVEYYFEKQKGVKEVISGFMGGDVKKPSYYEVIRGKTGHVETVEVIYDPKIVSYEELAKLFFEIHDPTQRDGQGPDIGSQYLSVAFYNNGEERRTIKKLIKILREKKYDVATTIKEKSKFYSAGGFHQDYYAKTGKLPYCHVYKKIFD